MMRPAMADMAAALSLLVSLTDTDVVAGVSLDGIPYVGHLRVNPDEHDRRQRQGLGAITNSGVLHALWSIPDSGIAIEEVHLRDEKTLRNAPRALVERSGECVRRRYSPPGEVLLLAAWRKGPRLAIERAMNIAPIFQRVAMWSMVNTPEDFQQTRLFQKARVYGLGLVESNGGSSATVLQAPRESVAGVSAVFRWFVAETAYDSWLQAQSAQASS